MTSVELAEKKFSTLEGIEPGISRSGAVCINRSTKALTCFLRDLYCNFNFTLLVHVLVDIKLEEVKVCRLPPLLAPLQSALGGGLLSGFPRSGLAHYILALLSCL